MAVLLGWKKGSLSFFILLLGCFQHFQYICCVFAGPTAGYVIAWFFVPMTVIWNFEILKQLLKSCHFSRRHDFCGFVGGIYLSVYMHMR